MKISLITATWNAEKSLPLMVQSLAEQRIDRSQLEWIVLDGGSSDDTLGVIERSGFKPDCLISEPDEGLYDALNKGVRLATGDVVGFLHADDFLSDSSTLLKVLEAFEMYDVDGVYGDLQYVKKEQDRFATVRHWASGYFDRSQLKWGWMPPHPSLYLKRGVYQAAALDNGDYFDTSYSCSADYDFMMRILKRFAVELCYVPDVLIKMQLGGMSNRSLKHILVKSKEDWRAIRHNRIGHVYTLLGKNLGKVGQLKLFRRLLPNIDN